MTVVDKTTGNRQPVYPKSLVSAMSDFEARVKEIAKSMDIGSGGSSGGGGGTTIINGAGVTSYSRPKLFTTNKNTITIYASTTILINHKRYAASKDITIDINSTYSFDERNGKDVYIFAAIDNNDIIKNLNSMNKNTQNC